VAQQLNEMGILWTTHGELSQDEMCELPKDRSWFEKEAVKLLRAYDLLEDTESQRVFANVVANRIAPLCAVCSWDGVFSKNQQYFDSDIVQLSQQESFVDCGAYTGDTIATLLEQVADYRAIYAFEMDYGNYKIMEEAYRTVEKIHLYNNAVWNEEKEIPYSVGEGSNEPRDAISVLKAGEGTTLVGKAVVPDEVLAGKEGTFIKMDIEGAEVPALLGCKKLITEQKPKLAICIYHKVSDFWEIPLLLKSYRPDYKFAVRHYTEHSYPETVLYVW